MFLKLNEHRTHRRITRHTKSEWYDVLRKAAVPVKHRRRGVPLNDQRHCDPTTRATGRRPSFGNENAVQQLYCSIAVYSNANDNESAALRIKSRVGLAPLPVARLIHAESIPYNRRWSSSRCPQLWISMRYSVWSSVWSSVRRGKHFTILAPTFFEFRSSFTIIQISVCNSKKFRVNFVACHRRDFRSSCDRSS